MEQFKWTEFYSEFATVLLQFKKDRKALIEKIKEIYIRANMKLPTLEKDNNLVDIEPFTIFGLFNKGITDSNRIAILNQIKDLFDIKAEVPETGDFTALWAAASVISAAGMLFLGKKKDDEE